MASNYHRILRLGAIAATTALLAACGGGGSSSSGSTSGVTISGTVSAPGGTVALYQPHGFERILAGIFGEPAYGAISGILNVGAGVTVNLIQVDAAGNQVGAVIASGTTGANGSYSINAPVGFTPGPQYVVRADGGSTTIDARVTSDSVDIDPVTNASSAIVTTGGNLANISVIDVDQITDAVDSIAPDLDATGLTVGLFTTALETAVNNDQEAANIVNSTSAAGTICGTVTDSNNAPLQNIVIVVRDFSNWVTRAKTRTNAAGSYCAHVPRVGDTNPDGGTFSGNYIVGAINATGSSFAASAWYTSSGGTYDQFSAGKVSVPSSTTVTVPFTLAAGGRIAGTVYATDGVTPLEGIKVIIRDFTDDEPVVITRTKPDGTFRVNVATGTYTVGVRNKTLQPYAGGLYNGPASGSSTPVTAGGSTATDATPITVSAGNTTTTSFNLAAGALIHGTVTDGTNAQPGMAVRFYDASATTRTGAFVDGLVTNRLGKYRIWLQPGTYSIMSRGQTNNATVIAGTGNSAEDFTSAVVNTVTATLQDGSGNGVSQVKVHVYDATGPAYAWQGFEVSNGDGTVTVYTTLPSVLLQFKLDNGQTALGSAIYSSPMPGTQLAGGTVVAPTTALGTITLPTGGELKGVVTAGSAPVGNAIVQVRNGGTSAAQRFISTRTQSDGSYSISLPAGAYARVCATYPGMAASTCPGTGSGTGSSAGQYAFQDGVAVTAGGSVTQNFAIP